MGEYQYRLTAWNAYGWSDYAPSGICTTANASLPCPPELCWRPEGCRRQPASLLEAVVAPGAAFGFGWRLVCSVGGTLLVVLLAGMRVMSSGQLEALAGLVQNSGLQGVRSRLRPSLLVYLSVSSMQRSCLAAWRSLTQLQAPQRKYGAI